MDLSAISWNPFKKSEDDNEVKNKKSVEQTPEAIDIYGKNNDTTISNKDNVSVFSQQTSNDDDMGLGIQKSIKTENVQKPENAKEKTTVETETKKTYTPAKGQVFNDEFIIKNYGHGLTKEKWDKMSPEEQDKIAGKFMNDMITNYNNDPKNKAKGLKSSVIHQYELYMKRCKTPEDVERLTRTCKFLDTDRQLDAFIKAHQYENPEFQAIAQRVLAEDVDKLDQSVQEQAHAHIKEKFGEDAQAIAVSQVGAMQDVEAQNRILNGYRELKNEKVDLSMSDNIGTYFKDKDGKVNEEYQLNLFNDLFQNGATDKVKENTARNTYQLTKDNQNTASDTVMASNNEAYINAMAENAYYFHEDNRDAIISKLENSGYESTREVLNNSRERYESGQGPTRSESAKDTSSKDTSTKSDTKTTSTEKAETPAKTTVTTTLSKAQASEKRIQSIISNTKTNTTQKAKQIKALGGNEKNTAIEKLMMNATLPEIKGLALSGLKSEVVNYLLDNLTPDNKSTLDSIKYLMTPKDIARYEKILSVHENQGQNFFMK